MTFFESGRPDSSWSPDPRDLHDPFVRLRRGYRRRRIVAVSIVVAVVAAALTGVVIAVGPEQVGQSARQIFAGEAPPPAPEMVALADRSFLTEEGRDLLYRSRPRLVGRDEIDDVCPIADDGSNALGCYSWAGGIFVYQPPEPRIADSAITTLAHELLHAAYNDLGTGERFGVHEMLYAEIARVPAEDPVHSQIEWSVGGHESSRETELFAYLGSQVMLEGGFAPELEAVYARYISDRPGLVGVYRQVDSVIDGVLADAQTALEQLAADESANVAERAQLEVDRVAHETARERYNQDADQYNQLPAGERGQWMATWTSADGTTRTQPLGESLAARLAELEQYRIDLDARAAALATAEASAVTRRAEVEAQQADVVALLEAAYPGQSFD